MSGPVPSAPRVWHLLSYRAGMNTQTRALADALAAAGCRVERKALVYRQGWRRRWPAYTSRVTLAGIDRRRSDPLDPPWPDLIVTAGRLNEPVCRWIRRRSEGQARLVFVGRTWAPLRHFDLVVTTPQYGLSRRSNVLHNHLTLHSVTRALLDAAAVRWRQTLGALPGPRVAVLVGGDSGPYVLGPKAAARLVHQATALAGQGTLMVTTSSRTSPAAVEVLRRNLPPSAFFYDYGDPSGQGDGDNPYLGLLAWADQVVVTGDSIAMLSEGVATGKPVHIFDLGTGRRSMAGPGVIRSEEDAQDAALAATLYRWRIALGPVGLARDIRRVHRSLVEVGRVRWLGAESSHFTPGLRGGSEPQPERSSVTMETTVRRVWDLLPDREVTAPVESQDLTSQAPSTWLLAGQKAGDRAQVMALAEGLGWPFVLQKDAKALKPPWPQLMIVAGRRQQKVVTGWQRQTGIRSRVVLIGRPRVPELAYDLLITTPQYDLPPSANHLMCELPLHGVTPEVLAVARQRWAEAMEPLRSPRLAVLLGGNSGPFVFTRSKVRRLVRSLNHWSSEHQGTLLVSTSPRTPPWAGAFLHRNLSEPHVLFGGPYGGDDALGENPFLGFLAWADGLVVTADSTSMLAEALATGRPVWVYDPEHHPVALPGERAPRPWWRRRLHRAALEHRWRNAFGPRMLRRDVGVLHRRLRGAGRLAWWGEPAAPGTEDVREEDLQRAVAAVRILVGSQPKTPKSSPQGRPVGANAGERV